MVSLPISLQHILLMKTPIITRLLSISILLLAAASVCSANLIVNGGFETGDLTGWTGSAIVNNVNPHSGTYAAAFTTQPGHNGSTMNQSFATIPGRHYDLTFWLAEDYNGGTSYFRFFSDSINNPPSNLFIWGGPSFGYREVSFDLKAIGSSITLEFNGFNRNGAWYVDDVSVTPHVNLTADSGSALMLLLIGITGLVFARYSMSWRKGRFPCTSLSRG
jgi:hypothetical protein